MNATNRSKKAHNGRNQFVKGNNATYLAKTENAAVIAFEGNEFNVVYFAQEMENRTLTNQAEAMEMFELVNMTGLTKWELREMGFTN
jgi:hypothetical protein